MDEEVRGREVSETFKYKVYVEGRGWVKKDPKYSYSSRFVEDSAGATFWNKLSHIKSSLKNGVLERLTRGKKFEVHAFKVTATYWGGPVNLTNGELKP